MKNTIALFILILYLFLSCTVVNSNSSKLEKNNKSEILSGEIMKNKINIETKSGDENKKDKLLEEGANVDTSNATENYHVETPTIILLSFFGILVVASIVLFIFKI